MINRSNYESYFIDYIDGNLPDELVNDFLDFLEKNPDLAEELKTVSTISLQPENCSFPDKDALLKADTLMPDEPEFRAVAYLEGDMAEAEKTHFEAELAINDELLKSMQLLAKTKLLADNSVRFPDKSQLMRKSPKVLYIRIAQAAAILVLFVSVWALAPWGKKPLNEQFFAQQEQPKQQPVVTKPENDAQPLQTNPAPAKSPENQTEEQRSVPKASQLQPKTTETRRAAAEPDLLAQREAMPTQIKPITQAIVASAGFEPHKVKMEIEEAAPKSAAKQMSVEQYLAHKLISAPKGETFTLANVANAGLKAAENLAPDRLNVERSQQGQLEQINFESRLIAFSIPFKKNR